MTLGGGARDTCAVASEGGAACAGNTSYRKPEVTREESYSWAGEEKLVLGNCLLLLLLLLACWTVVPSLYSGLCGLFAPATSKVLPSLPQAILQQACTPLPRENFAPVNFSKLFAEQNSIGSIL